MKRISCQRDRSIGLRQEPGPGDGLGGPARGTGPGPLSPGASPHLQELVHPQPVDARPLSFEGLQEALHEQQLCREQSVWVSATIPACVRVTEFTLTSVNILETVDQAGDLIGKLLLKKKCDLLKS